jgi:hypothetical protein
MRTTTPDKGPAAAGSPSTQAGDGRRSRETAGPAARELVSRVGRAAAVAAVTVGLSAGVAAPASAAPDPTPGTALSIHGPTDSSGHHEVQVSGVFAMSQADAQHHVARLGDGGVRYEIVHDDHGAGDIVESSWVDRGTSRPGEEPGRSFHATPEGLRFTTSVLVERDALDEDDRWADRTDEVYVRVSFVDRDGDHWWESASDVVVDEF